MVKSVGGVSLKPATIGEPSSSSSLSSTGTIQKVNSNKSLIPIPTTDYQTKYHNLMRKNQGLAKENSLLKEKVQRMRYERRMEMDVHNSLSLNPKVHDVLLEYCPTVVSNMKQFKIMLEKVTQDVNQLSKVMEDACQLSGKDTDRHKRISWHMQQDEVELHRRCSFDRVREEFKSRFTDLSAIMETSDSSRIRLSGPTRSSGSRSSIIAICHMESGVHNDGQQNVYDFVDDPFVDHSMAQKGGDMAASTIDEDRDVVKPIEDKPKEAEELSVQPKPKKRSTIKKKKASGDEAVKLGFGENSADNLIVQHNPRQSRRTRKQKINYAEDDTDCEPQPKSRTRSRKAASGP